MLTDIYIENFTIIEQLNLELESGMTAITGETGAGKSIIVDALSYALGNRADSSVVRHGCQKADISATFYLDQDALASQWLKEHDMPLEDQQVILRRVINQDGRSKAYINGKPTTLALQKQLGQLLVDIHGQHEYHQLLKPDYHASILDRFAKHPLLLETVRQTYKAWQSAQKRVEDYLAQAQEIEDKKELLGYQVQELDEANFSQEELASLDSDYKRLANAQELQSLAWRTTEALQESDTAVNSQLNHAIHLVEQMAEYDTQYATALDTLNQANSLIDDAAREISAISSDIDIDEEALTYLESRIALAHELSRKHRVPPSELADIHQQFSEELRQLESASGNLEQMQHEMAECLERYSQAAIKLSQSRTAAALKLQKSITPIIQQLGMPHGKIEFSVQHDPEVKQAAGQDNIQILVSTNPDQPLQSLTQVASGGELSRISLAIEVITLDKHTASTLIFDEVDVGIGGGTAEIVGQLLRQVSSDMQVLCITHQAQVAGQAHHHLVVQKSHQDNKTSSLLNYLARQQRVEEMARMLGGLKITEATRSTAQELLAEA
jgi:DNA repair protein RecN (Recombination protein N)